MRSKTTTIQDTTQTGTKAVPPVNRKTKAKPASAIETTTGSTTIASSPMPDIAPAPTRKTKKMDGNPASVSRPDVPLPVKMKVEKADAPLPITANGKKADIPAASEPTAAKSRGKRPVTAPPPPQAEAQTERVSAAIRWYEPEPAERKPAKPGASRKTGSAPASPPVEKKPAAATAEPKPDILQAEPKHKRAAAEPRSAATPRKTRISLNRAIAARASEKMAAKAPAQMAKRDTMTKTVTLPAKPAATVKGPGQTAKPVVEEVRVLPAPPPTASVPKPDCSSPPPSAVAGRRKVSPAKVETRRATPVKPEVGGRKRISAVQGDRAVVQPMVVLDNGRIWKMAGNSAVAYVRTAANACAILKSEPGQLAKRAMAVYRDRNGKAIAWQVRFEAARWAEVEGMLK